MTVGNIYYLIYCLVYPFVYILLSTGSAETTLTGKWNSFLRSALRADILCCIPIGRVFVIRASSLQIQQSNPNEKIRISLITLALEASNGHGILILLS
ncbi:MAG: hypothetical protein HY097_08875 [Nitrospinae bacterium]|nr:hypothetical protein [Nitrospinota bacterium]